MILIQSYFNNNITDSNIDFSGGYLSAVVNWLSMAYSCLLLKKNNPDTRLVFYGNESVARLFESGFGLPYDKYVVINCNGKYANWFYCWPKIVAYQNQEKPFIHIDTDVFMWKSMPQRLLKAPLVTQHQERDSIFYMDVYKQIKSDCVKMPQYLTACNDGKYISSYNAGLLGGNDIDFLKSYLNEISKFLDSNADRILKSNRRFLYNVVFEQWLFYGLAKKQNKKVATYYKDIITDFNMGNDSVSQQVHSFRELDYMHVMDKKDNIRCNRFIAYKMQKEFPQEFDRILSVCKNKGVKSEFYTYYENDNVWDSHTFSRSKRLESVYGYSNKELQDLIKFETIKANFLLQFQNSRQQAVETQIEFRANDILSKGANTKFSKAILSPYVKIVEADGHLTRLLLHGTDGYVDNDTVILLVYNAVFNRIDEFMWSKTRLRFLLSLLDENVNINDLQLNRHDVQKPNKLSDFYRQCLFDGIIIFI